MMRSSSKPAPPPGACAWGCCMWEGGGPWPAGRPGRAMPISAAASACTCSMVLASSFSRRGIHLFFLRSITSLDMNLILEGSLSFLQNCCRRAKYASMSGLAAWRGEASKCLPTVMSRLHSASTFSSGGRSLGLGPSKSLMHACRIFSIIIFSLNNSPIKRMLPRVASFTFRILSSRSSGLMSGCSAISCITVARAAAAPSNSSWHVFSRMRRNVMERCSPSAGGNSGSAMDSLTHSLEYREQKVGSATALSKMSEITLRRVSAELMPIVTIWSESLSNFSGVILFRIPLTERRSLSLSDLTCPICHGVSAFLMSGPGPGGMGAG
mmetsp:Transcript_4574/g.8606  ORF Transcript_4574/g.8606 Transcript_4574/m.8606 type:complete len:325 (+) Transcript_4574:1309-2283(+)